MKFNEFINDNHKNKNWFVQNYLFAGTFFIIFVNLLLYTVGGSFGSFRSVVEIDNLQHWTSVLYFNHIARSFLNSFAHLNLQHALLNMLCFSVCGLYLERKKGSIKFVLLILALAFFTSTAISANYNSVNWTGFSGVNYGLYFYILTDYLFSFQKSKRKWHNIIIGAVALALIYIFTCFSGGVSSFSFKIYPYDLITNLGHYSAALTGLIVGLMIKITHLKTDKNSNVI